MRRCWIGRSKSELAIASLGIPRYRAAVLLLQGEGATDALRPTTGMVSVTNPIRLRIFSAVMRSTIS